MEHKIQKRESNFELLRIICIIGIVNMHVFGSVYNHVSGFNLVYGTLINSAFNTGVTLFMLISGYFGVKSTVRKVVSLELTVVFYSLVSLTVGGLLGNTIGLKDIVKSFFPVSMGKYWYITAYMLILVFAKYINHFLDSLEKREYQVFLLLMLSVFSILPTIIQVHVMNDSGKGIMNMLLVYSLGRYLRKYEVDFKFKKVVALIVLLIEFALNLGIAFIKGGKGVNAPFARDYSIFIIILSVFVFLWVKDLKLKSSLINGMAQNVIGIYLMEGAIRQILANYVDLSTYSTNMYLIFIISGEVLVIVCLSSLVEIIRRNTFAKVELLIASFLEKIVTRF